MCVSKSIVVSSFVDPLFFLLSFHSISIVIDCIDLLLPQKLIHLIAKLIVFLIKLNLFSNYCGEFITISYCCLRLLFFLSLDPLV